MQEMHLARYEFQALECWSTHLDREVTALAGILDGWRLQTGRSVGIVAKEEMQTLKDAGLKTSGAGLRRAKDLARDLRNIQGIDDYG